MSTIQKYNLKVGDKVMNLITSVTGTIIEIYKPTGASEQIIVETQDGGKYHAPTNKWVPINVGFNLSFVPDFTEELLNPYGRYVVSMAKNHGISVDEAIQKPICKARLEYFNKTGQ